MTDIGAILLIIFAIALMAFVFIKINKERG
jgi:cbb3-type cytochrome oxidase subunit 3